MYIDHDGNERPLAAANSFPRAELNQRAKRGFVSPFCEGRRPRLSSSQGETERGSDSINNSVLWGQEIATTPSWTKVGLLFRIIAANYPPRWLLTIKIVEYIFVFLTTIASIDCFCLLSRRYFQTYQLRTFSSLSSLIIGAHPKTRAI